VIRILKQQNVPGIREQSWWIATGTGSGNMDPSVFKEGIYKMWYRGCGLARAKARSGSSTRTLNRSAGAQWRGRHRRRAGLHASRWGISAAPYATLNGKPLIATEYSRRSEHPAISLLSVSASTC
jgi:hypothetical protein